MASRNFENKVNHNITGLTFVNFEVTFDADAEANAFVVDRGQSYLAATPFVRNGEGDWSFVLADRYVSYVGFIAHSNAADVNIEFVSEDVAGTSPLVRLRFTVGSTGTATDPDGDKVHVTLLLSNSVARIPS